MSTKSETVNDIVVETYFECDRATEQTTWNRSEVERLVRRIEEAHKREINDCAEEISRRGEEINRLRDCLCDHFRMLKKGVTK